MRLCWRCLPDRPELADFLDCLGLDALILALLTRPTELAGFLDCLGLDALILALLTRPTRAGGFS